MVTISHMFLHGRHIQVDKVLENIYNALKSIFGFACTIVSYNLHSNHVILRDDANILLQLELFCYKQNTIDKVWYLDWFCLFFIRLEMLLMRAYTIYIPWSIIKRFFLFKLRMRVTSNKIGK